MVSIDEYYVFQGENAFMNILDHKKFAKNIITSLTSSNHNKALTTVFLQLFYALYLLYKRFMMTGILQYNLVLGTMLL